MPDLPQEHFRTAAYLAAIVDSSEDAIISKNLSGIIESWNRSAERIFGYSAEEAIGRDIGVIFSPALYDEEVQILGRLRQGERIEHFETVRKRKDGTRIDISLTISPIRDEKGEIIAASTIGRHHAPEACPAGDRRSKKPAGRDIRQHRRCRGRYRYTWPHHLYQCRCRGAAWPPAGSDPWMAAARGISHCERVHA